VELGVVPPRGGAITFFIKSGKITILILWRHVLLLGCLVCVSHQSLKSFNLRGGHLGNFFFSLVDGGSPCPTIKISQSPLESNSKNATTMQIGSAVLGWQALRWPMLSLKKFDSDSPNTSDPCPGHASEVRPCHTRFLRPKPDAHRMYAQDQVVIHTVRI
jgi:hypothetical protein